MTDRGALNKADAEWLKSANTNHEPVPAPGFQLVPFDHLTIDTKPSYLVKDWISKNALIVAWGPPKSGKSFWVFDLVTHIAIGRSYRGHKVKQGAVVYIVAEGSSGIGARAEAWRQRNLSQGAEPVPLYFLMKRLDLKEDRKTLINDIRAVIGEIGLAGIVVDTLNRTYQGSESSDQDMTAYIAAADEIKEAFKCAVIIVHHSGLDTTRLRGHSSLKGALDIEIEIKKDAAGLVTATVVVAKDMADGTSNTSLLEIVEVGINDEGDPIKTCVIVPTDEPARPKEAKKRVKLSRGNERALGALRKAIGEAGDVAPASNHVPAKARVVHIDLWRKYAYAVDSESAYETKKKAFSRAKADLQGMGLIGDWQGLIWIIDGGA